MLLVLVLSIVGLALLAHRHKEHLPSLDAFTTIFDRDRPGERLSAFGLRAHHPIVIVPGIISTGLELWQTKPCADGRLRSRVWGSSSMVQSLLADPGCWLEHMVLNGTTGMDPVGVRVRAAQGLEAADYFMAGYWLWARVIEDLSLIGYDPNNLVLMAYDWRLALPQLQARDDYFARFKAQVEQLYRAASGRKVVVAAHSMGGVVWQWMQAWAERAEPGWVDKHVHAVLHIGTPHLGVPKAVSASLSGEMRDTAELGAWLDYARKKMLSALDMVALFRGFFSVMSMGPKGGERVWGDDRGAPDDHDGAYQGSKKIKKYLPYGSGNGSGYEESQCGAYLDTMWTREGLMQPNIGADAAHTENSVLETGTVTSSCIDGGVGICLADVDDYAHIPPQPGDLREVCDACAAPVEMSYTEKLVYMWNKTRDDVLYPALAEADRIYLSAREALLRSRAAPVVPWLDDAGIGARAVWAWLKESGAVARRVLWEWMQGVGFAARGMGERVKLVGTRVIGDRERGLLSLAQELEQELDHLGVTAKIDSFKNKLSPIRLKLRQLTSTVGGDVNSLLHELETFIARDWVPELHAGHAWGAISNGWWRGIEQARDRAQALKQTIQHTAGRVATGVTALVSPATTSGLPPVNRGVMIEITGPLSVPTRPPPASTGVWPSSNASTVEPAAIVQNNKNKHMLDTSDPRAATADATTSGAGIGVVSGVVPPPKDALDWFPLLCGGASGRVRGADVASLDTLCYVNDVCSFCSGGNSTSTGPSNSTEIVPDAIDSDDLYSTCDNATTISTPTACRLCDCAHPPASKPLASNYTASGIFTLLGAVAQRYGQKIGNTYSYGVLSDMEKGCNSNVHNVDAYESNPLLAVMTTRARNTSAAAPSASDASKAGNMTIAQYAVCDLPDAVGGGYARAAAVLTAAGAAGRRSSDAAGASASGGVGGVGGIDAGINAEDGVEKEVHTNAEFTCADKFSDVLTFNDPGLNKYVDLCAKPPRGSGNVRVRSVAASSDERSEQRRRPILPHTESIPEMIAAAYSVSADGHAPAAAARSGGTSSGAPVAASASETAGRASHKEYSWVSARPHNGTSLPESDPALFLEAQRLWSNPVVTPLPWAPHLTLFNMYGVSKLTERAYVYRVNPDPVERVHVPVVLDLRAHDPARGMSHGVKYSDGDGTVPLISTGYASGDAGIWSYRALNPSASEVVALEYLHTPATGSEAMRDAFRLTGTSGDHVDIIGNSQLISDLAVIAGRVDVSVFKDKIDELVPEALSNIVAKDLAYAPEKDSPANATDPANDRLARKRAARWRSLGLSVSTSSGSQCPVPPPLVDASFRSSALQNTLPVDVLEEVLRLGQWPFRELPDSRGVIKLQSRKISCIDEISKRIRLPLGEMIDWGEVRRQKRASKKKRRELEKKEEERRDNVDTWGTFRLPVKP